jgi:hypothetical protein
MLPPMQPTPPPSGPPSPCVHRWRVGTPVNGQCAALCVHCGARRSYPATVSASPRNAMTVRRHT